MQATPNRTYTQLNRRHFLKAAVGTAGAALVGGCTNRHTKSQSLQQPNIIFLLTDDQRWDALGCAGNPLIKTPNLDKMAASGVHFTNCFVTTSICCTSRASIFSGQYARRHGIHDFTTDFTNNAWQNTYPQLLRESGYYTGFVGKFGVGTNLPQDQFDAWYGIHGQPVYEIEDEHGNIKHLTEQLGDHGLDFLRNCPQSRPFCLSVSFKAPHVEDMDPRQFIYDKQYETLYQDLTIEKPSTADEATFQALPEFLKTSEARLRWYKRFDTEEKYQNMVKGYYRLVTGVDAVVGRIRKELKKQELDENTIIIFTSDNGFYLGEYGLAGKWFGHECSIRVPLIVYDPRLPKHARGLKNEAMALNIDMAPTILDYAGVKPPSSMQGRSLRPLIDNRTLQWRDDFFYEHLFEYEGIPIPKSIGVRTEKWKYLRYIDEQPVYETLFDLENDPHEINDLARKDGYQDILKLLSNRCDQYIKGALKQLR